MNRVSHCRRKLQVAPAAKLVDHALQRQTVGSESFRRPAPVRPCWECWWIWGCHINIGLKPQPVETLGHFQWLGHKQG